MAQPQRDAPDAPSAPDAPAATSSRLADALLRLQRAMREAADEPALLVAAVGALSADDTCAWIACDRDDAEGLLRVLTAGGTGADALARVQSAAAAGAEPWRAAAEDEGLALIVWSPLDAAALPSAHLGIAVARGDETAAWLDGAVGAEIARWIGAALDARADRAAAGRLLATAGRVAWLEVVRQASRTIAHDLANVLTGMSFLGSEIAGQLPPGPSTADAAAMGDAAIRSGQLLDQLRGLCREASEADVVPLDPAAVVDATTALLAFAARPASLTVGPLDSMVVRASRRILEESVVALVVDARQAAVSSGIAASALAIRVGVAAETVTEGARAGIGPGRYAAVVAESDAAAQDQEVAGGMPSLADTAPGETGFGLALAAAGARAMGGAVRVERTAGGGARTTILLPEAASRRRSGQAASGVGASDDAPGGDQDESPADG